jgi:ribosomal protein L37AE/L43A
MMNHPKACPICANQVLRHIRSGTVYWLCRHCRQAVPVLESAGDLEIPQTKDATKNAVKILPKTLKSYVIVTG